MKCLFVVEKISTHAKQKKTKGPLTSPWPLGVSNRCFWRTSSWFSNECMSENSGMLCNRGSLTAGTWEYTGPPLEKEKHLNQATLFSGSITVNLPAGCNSAWRKVWLRKKLGLGEQKSRVICNFGRVLLQNGKSRPFLWCLWKTANFENEPQTKAFRFADCIWLLFFLVSSVDRIIFRMILIPLSTQDAFLKYPFIFVTQKGCWNSKIATVKFRRSWSVPLWDGKTP